jgi:spermidine synthase
MTDQPVTRTDAGGPDGDDEVWFTETLHDGYRASIKVRRTLFDSRSGRQHLVIAESVRFGTLVTLDGVTQLTSADEYVYHEMLSHVPILAHGDIRQVLIIGGGDGGMAEETFKHSSIEHITLVEIDPWVVGVSKRHLRDVNGAAFDDPRLELVIADGKDYVASTEASFDLIVVDSTDPHGPGKPLFEHSFYADCRRLLRPGGVIVTQNGVPFFQGAELESTMRSFASLFADATCYLAAVPTYIGGFMAFGWGTDDPGLRQVSLDTLQERLDASGIATRYYTPDVHLASFALPRFILEIVERAHSG